MVGLNAGAMPAPDSSEKRAAPLSQSGNSWKMLSAAGRPSAVRLTIHCAGREPDDAGKAARNDQ